MNFAMSRCVTRDLVINMEPDDVLARPAARNLMRLDGVAKLGLDAGSSGRLGDVCSDGSMGPLVSDNEPGKFDEPAATGESGWHSW